LSKGAILADEVGLGKTIEAGLLIAQKWAERKRRILVITPANLRKQWHQELADKFGIAASLLEAKSYRQAIKDGAANPFDLAGNGATVLICSYQFAAGKAKDVQSVPWDLVVIDEAHRLRNVYKPENKTARILRDALMLPHKVLLTATPLQNSLLELYGLVSFVDERVFGDLDSFRAQFGQLKDAASFDALKNRIAADLQAHAAPTGRGLCQIHPAHSDAARIRSRCRRNQALQLRIGIPATAIPLRAAE
jgi:SNF2 family DNA or RNA helicase